MLLWSLINVFIKEVDFVKFVPNHPWMFLHHTQTLYLNPCLQERETLSAHPGEPSQSSRMLMWVSQLFLFICKEFSNVIPQRYWLNMFKEESNVLCSEPLWIGEDDISPIPYFALHGLYYLWHLLQRKKKNNTQPFKTLRSHPCPWLNFNLMLYGLPPPGLPPYRDGGVCVSQWSKELSCLGLYAPGRSSNGKQVLWEDWVQRVSSGSRRQGPWQSYPQPSEACSRHVECHLPDGEGAGAGARGWEVLTRCMAMASEPAFLRGFLWIWRSHSTASLRESCGGFSGIMGCQAPLCGLSVSCMTGVRAWSAWPAVSRTPVRVEGVKGFRFGDIRLVDRFSALCRWCGPVSSIRPLPTAYARAVCSRVWSGRDENQHFQIWGHASRPEKKVECLLRVGE